MARARGVGRAEFPSRDAWFSYKNKLRNAVGETLIKESQVPAVPNGIVHYVRLGEARLIYLKRPTETVFLDDSLSANGMLALRKLGMPVGSNGDDVYECEVPV
jgi:hypothetical protein